MSESPFGYRAKGVLIGFPALYAIFVVGCIVLFISVLIYMHTFWEQTVFLFFLSGDFVVLIVYAIIRERRNPDTFGTKQTVENIYREIKDWGKEEPQVTSPKTFTGEGGKINP